MVRKRMENGGRETVEDPRIWVGRRERRRIRMGTESVGMPYLVNRIRNPNLRGIEDG